MPDNGPVPPCGEGLDTVDVSGKEYSSVPPGCFDKSAASLTQLDLYANKIKEIPTGVLGQIKGLKILNAFNNVIKKLPPDVGGLAELEEVNFAANKLMMIDDAKFLSWSAVSVLNLYDNNLVRMGSLEPLKALTELRISGNNLEEMPVLCDNCPITIYEIHKNRITKMCARAEPSTRHPHAAHAPNGRLMPGLPPVPPPPALWQGPRLLRKDARARAAVDLGQRPDRAAGELARVLQPRRRAAAGECAHGAAGGHVARPPRDPLHPGQQDHQAAQGPRGPDEPQARQPRGRGRRRSDGGSREEDEGRRPRPRGRHLLDVQE